MGNTPTNPGVPYRGFGSSPRAWGTQCNSAAKVSVTRFIPTGVGNTSLDYGDHRSRTVHPHGRGEHYATLADKLAHMGSSPRAWGTLQVRADASAHRRFIPTGVGNTSAHVWAGAVVPVHPHGRGEHWNLLWYCWSRCGSSPRAWGTRHPQSYRPTPVRFIPTGVGNTSTGLILNILQSVHPHGRGEHSSIASSPITKSGSSPRAWGTL